MSHVHWHGGEELFNRLQLARTSARQFSVVVKWLLWIFGALYVLGSAFGFEEELWLLLPLVVFGVVSFVELILETWQAMQLERQIHEIRLELTRGHRPPPKQV